MFGRATITLGIGPHSSLFRHLKPVHPRPPLYAAVSSTPPPAVETPVSTAGFLLLQREHWSGSRRFL